MRSAFTTYRMGILKVAAVVLLITISAMSYGRASNSFFRVFWNSFRASVKNNAVLLSWEVTEYNNRSFHIQHSVDGQVWKNVDSVVSRRSLESLEEYSYTHVNNTGGKHYYRVKDIDIDGKLIGYSEVITVSIKNDSQDVTVWPNPATNQVRISAASGTDDFYTRARIYDLSGKIVAERTLNSHNDPININDLTPGVYFIRADSKNGSVHTQKIVKQ